MNIHVHVDLFTLNHFYATARKIQADWTHIKRG